MGEELRTAHTVVVVLGDYEWVFNDALIGINGGAVEIWRETEEGAREHVATAPLANTFIAWRELAEFELDDHEADHRSEEG